MRLFIAVELSGEIQDYLLGLQKRFAGVGGIVFVKESHLTLKFLGDVSSFVAKQVEDRLARIKFGEFKVELSGLGVFPDEVLARVLWVGLSPEGEINVLQRKIDVVLRDFFPLEKSFKPHLTLGRIKFLKDKKSFVDLVKKTKVKGLELRIGSFALVKSELSSEGAKYVVLKNFKC